MKKEHHGVIYGLIAAILSAGIAILMKWIAAPAETIIFFRFAVGLPLIWGITRTQGMHIRVRRVPRHLMQGILGLLSVYSYIYALRLIPVVNAITLGNTAPLFMPFVVLFWLKILVSKWRFVAAGIGFVGVCILMRPGTDLFEVGSFLGLITGITSTFALVGIKQLSKKYSSMQILFYYFLFSTIASFYPMIITWKPVKDIYAWMGLIGIGIASLLFQYCLTKSYTHAAATKMSIFNYLAIVFGGLGGWMIFGEIPDLWVWIGSIVIVCGAILAIFDQTPPRPFKFTK